jgi:hypothetical protein
MIDNHTPRDMKTILADLKALLSSPDNHQYRPSFDLTIARSASELIPTLNALTDGAISPTYFLDIHSENGMFSDNSTLKLREETKRALHHFLTDDAYARCTHLMTEMLLREQAIVKHNTTIGYESVAPDLHATNSYPAYLDTDIPLTDALNRPHADTTHSDDALEPINPEHISAYLQSGGASHFLRALREQHAERPDHLKYRQRQPRER